jgi:hypothetical protein
VNPNAKRSPSDTDKCHSVHHWLSQDRNWDQGRYCTRFDPNERNKAQEADNQQEVHVRRAPAEEWRVVPCNIDKDEARDSEYRACPVHARSVCTSRKLSIVRERLGDCNDGENREAPAGESV